MPSVNELLILAEKAMDQRQRIQVIRDLIEICKQRQSQIDSLEEDFRKHYHGIHGTPIVRGKGH